MGSVIDMPAALVDLGWTLDRGAHTHPGALVARIGQQHQPLGGGLVYKREHVQACGGDIGRGSGLDLRDPQRFSTGVGQELDVAAVAVFVAAVPKVALAGGAGLRTTVTRKQFSVQDQGVFGARTSLFQDLVQVGGLVGQHVDTLLDVAVAGGPADVVVPGQSVDGGVIAKPPQDQDRLFVAGRRAGARAGAASPTFGVQQGRKVPNGALVHIEGGSTGNHVEPFMVVRCRFDTSPSTWGSTPVSGERKFTHGCASRPGCRFPADPQSLRSPHSTDIFVAGAIAAAGGFAAPTTIYALGMLLRTRRESTVAVQEA